MQGPATHDNESSLVPTLPAIGAFFQIKKHFALALHSKAFEVIRAGPTSLSATGLHGVLFVAGVQRPVLFLVSATTQGLCVESQRMLVFILRVALVPDGGAYGWVSARMGAWLPVPVAAKRGDALVWRELVSGVCARLLACVCVCVFVCVCLCVWMCERERKPERARARARVCVGWLRVALVRVGGTYGWGGGGCGPLL